MVYFWDYTDGQWTRTRIDRKDRAGLEALWESTTPAMRVYNSFRNEYDIYKPLDTELTTEQEYSMLEQDDYDDYEDYSADHAAWQRQQQQRVEDLGTAQAQDQANRRGSPQRREQRQQQPREPHGHMEVSAQSQHTLDAMHEDTPEPEPAQIGDHEVSTLEDLRDRYAIVTRPGYAIDPLDAPRRRIDARKAMAILCLDANQVPAVAHQPISNFVSCDVENQRPPRATVALSRKSLVDQKYRFEAKIINHSWLYDVWRYGLPRTVPQGLNDEVFHIVEKNPI